MLLSFIGNLDLTSFILGFATATVVLWLVRRITPPIRDAIRKSREKRAANRSSSRLTVEYDYRNDFIRHAQGLHLSSSLFSLDEVLIPPLLLAPPPQTIPGEDNFLTDTLSKILSFMPDYPEFASIFGAEKLTLAEALKGGANIALTGPAGSGKTVTLAHFGTQVASFSSETGDLAEFVPFYVHAADLQLPLPEEEDSFNAIYYAISNSGYLSRKTSARLSNLIQIALSENRTILLLDGLDEVSPKDIERIRTYLRDLIIEHPEIRIVASISSEFSDGLTSLGLHTISVAGWTSADRSKFIANWSNRWSENIDGGVWQNAKSPAEHQMLTNWLGRDSTALTPLELTLRTWAVFAGDVLGPKNQHSINAYIRRMAGNISGVETALERVGMQMVLARRPVIPARAATLWSRGQMVDSDDIDLLSQKIEELSDDDDSSPRRVSRSTVTSLISAGVLVERQNERISFIHPVIAGYFAGRGFANFGRAGKLARQQAWSLRETALHYLSCQTDISPLIESLDNDELTHSEILVSGRWLRDMEQKSNNRTLIMRKLVSIFQDENQPANLRQRAMAALTLSADPGISSLGRKLLSSPDPLVRSMSVLSMSYLRNEKYLPDLTKATTDEAFAVRAAACFALANFNTKEAIETVATSLLHGDEDTQHAAAEALAIDPEEGFEYLLEAVQEKDVSIRRSAIFGLGKTRTQEAIEVIQKIQLEDEQWIVRNAATQEILKLERGSAAVPRPFEPLHHLGWLAAFAGESGEGIAPGRAAADMLFRALMKGNMEQRKAAMDHYRLSGSGTVWTALHEIIKQPHGTEIHNAALETLWHLRRQGFLPYKAQPVSAQNPELKTPNMVKDKSRPPA